MKARSPAIIVLIAIGSVIAQGAGVLSTVGSALIGIDSGIRATIDLKALAAKIVPPSKPKFVPIKPVVVPAKVPVKK